MTQNLRGAIPDKYLDVCPNCNEKQLWKSGGVHSNDGSKWQGRKLCLACGHEIYTEEDIRPKIIICGQSSKILQ